MKSKNIIILDTETTGTKFPRRFKYIIKLKKERISMKISLINATTRWHLYYIPLK